MSAVGLWEENKKSSVEAKLRKIEVHIISLVIGTIFRSYKVKLVTHIFIYANHRRSSKERRQNMLRKWRIKWLKFTRLVKKREHLLKPHKEKSLSTWRRQLQSFVNPDLRLRDCLCASHVLTVFYRFGDHRNRTRAVLNYFIFFFIFSEQTFLLH